MNVKIRVKGYIYFGHVLSNNSTPLLCHKTHYIFHLHLYLCTVYTTILVHNILLCHRLHHNLGTSKYYTPHVVCNPKLTTFLFGPKYYKVGALSDVTLSRFRWLLIEKFPVIRWLCSRLFYFYVNTCHFESIFYFGKIFVCWEGIVCFPF